MAPQPAPGPTGNALSDANAASQPQLTQQQLAAVGVGLSGTLTSQGPECLWPPPGMFGIGTGLLALSFGVPCLITKSEARAVIGAGLLVAGAFITQFGFVLLVAAEVAPTVLTIAGIRALGGRLGGSAPEPQAKPMKLSAAQERRANPPLQAPDSAPAATTAPAMAS